jgi:hypothetical protein
MLISKHGIHGPNSKMADAQNPWGRIRAGNASWLKLLYDGRFTTHTVEDARIARGRGLQVLVRTGQGAIETGNLMPDENELKMAMAHFGAYASVIEVGNEPPTNYRMNDAYHPTRWDHALRMEEIIYNQRDVAHFFGQQLITGGWAMNEDGAPQGPPTGTDGLNTRIRTVYNQFDGIGVHLYDSGHLTEDYVKLRLRQWCDCFPHHPIYITEYGIAYRWVFGGPDSGHSEAEHQMEKVRRYYDFVTMLQREFSQVVAAFVFIVGGTQDWASFNGQGYDPNGQNSYWLGDQAWAGFGRLLAPTT